MTDMIPHSFDASQLNTGTIATARLGSGTASASTYLRGDQTWAAVTAGIGGTISTSDAVVTVSSSGAVKEVAQLLALTSGGKQCIRATSGTLCFQVVNNGTNGWEGVDTNGNVFWSCTTGASFLSRNGYGLVSDPDGFVVTGGGRAIARTIEFRRSTGGGSIDARMHTTSSGLIRLDDGSGSDRDLQLRSVTASGVVSFSGYPTSLLPAAASNAGAITYDTTLAKHVGCNGSSWNALW